MQSLFYSAEQSANDFIAHEEYEFAVYSARSPFKITVNEDCAAWVRIAADRWVFMVADGLGGLPAGEAASILALETIIAQLTAAKNEAQSRGIDLDLRAAILEGIDQANSKILSAESGGATTLTVVELDYETARPYHIGDAVIMIGNNQGELYYDTISHSPVGYIEAAGLLEETDAMMHHDRNIVANVVGSEHMRIEIGPKIQLTAGDMVILASDGLRDNLTYKQVLELMDVQDMEKSIRDLSEQCTAAMTAETIENPCHPDDLTILGLTIGSKD